MEIPFVIVLSFLALAWPLFMELAEAGSREPRPYEYREYSRFNQWYMRKFRHAAYMVRVNKDIAYMEHELDVGHHKFFPDDCSFCKVDSVMSPKEELTVGVGSLVEGINETFATYNQLTQELKVNQHQLQTLNEQRFELEYEPIYDYLSDLYMFNNGLKLTGHAYKELREQGRLAEVVSRYDHSPIIAEEKESYDIHSFEDGKVIATYRA